jgi:hypothetical protein
MSSNTAPSIVRTTSKIRRLAQSEALRLWDQQKSRAAEITGIIQAAAGAVSVKEHATTTCAGGYKPPLARSEMASTGRHDEGSIPHCKLKRRAALCASRRLTIDNKLSALSKQCAGLLVIPIPQSRERNPALFCAGRGNQSGIPRDARNDRLMRRLTTEAAKVAGGRPVC